MARTFVLFVTILLLLITEHTKASSCVEIADNNSRLACFDSAVRCRAESNDAKRLACFDQAFDKAQPMQEKVLDSVTSSVPSSTTATSTTSSAIPAEEVIQKTNPPVISVSKQDSLHSQPIDTKPNQQRIKEDEFGLPDRDRAKNSNFIEATIERVQTNANRIDYLKLDNGQVWREVEDGRLRFKVGQKVRIESGLLSSYKLKIVGKSLSVKVKRTK